MTLDDMPRSSSPRAAFAWAALAYTVFVIYGSLVPLDFRPLPWDEALARFGAMPFLHLGIASRADWVANLLLFIPLTFLWMGAITGRAGIARLFLASIAVIPVATALSLAIEFTQLFFPQRTVSQNDVFAETLGGVLGVALWGIAGARFSGWLGDWQRAQARAALAERLAWVYLAGLFIYNVLPLDLTLSAVEIFHKWREGRVNLVPFGDVPHDPAQAVYEIATDVLIWVPLAVLWRLDGTRRALRVWAMAFVTAAALEFLQLFVYSRVSDVTDIVTGALGGALGAVLGGVWQKHVAAAPRSAPAAATYAARRWLPWALAAGWTMALLFVFWFPFDFRIDRSFVVSRLDFLQRLPFEVYYFGTEYRAATEVLRKSLFFAPLGALLAWGVARQPWQWRGPLAGVAIAVLLGLPGVVEFGQVLLPDKIADTTDWLLAACGGLAGYAVARRMLRAPRTAGSVVPSAPARPSGRHPARGAWHPLVVLTLGAFLFWSSSHAGFLPYNVRELLSPDHPALSAGLLALACYWFAVWPVAVARRRVSSQSRLIQLPIALVVYGLVGFALLYAAVPDESLYDLAGSPILGWPAPIELAVRWTALATLPGAVLYLAVQTVRRLRGLPLRAMHFLAALPPLLLAYWGIVVEAATDNVVELLAMPPAFGFIALALWLYTLFVGAILIASPATRRAIRILAAVLTLPLAAGLLSIGLAGDIDKYGQQFSALQFLLSTDRAHYAGPLALWVRYVLFHVLVIATLAFIQWPHLRGTRQPYRQATHALH